MYETQHGMRTVHNPFGSYSQPDRTGLTRLNPKLNFWRKKQTTTRRSVGAKILSGARKYLWRRYLFFNRKWSRSGSPNWSKILQQCILLSAGIMFVDLRMFFWQNLDTNLHELFVKASWYSKDLIGISALRTSA